MQDRGLADACQSVLQGNLGVKSQIVRTNQVIRETLSRNNAIAHDIETLRAALGKAPAGNNHHSMMDAPASEAFQLNAPKHDPLLLLNFVTQLNASVNGLDVPPVHHIHGLGASYKQLSGGLHSEDLVEEVLQLLAAKSNSEVRNGSYSLESVKPLLPGDASQYLRSEYVKPQNPWENSLPVHTAPGCLNQRSVISQQLAGLYADCSPDFPPSSGPSHSAAQVFAAKNTVHQMAKKRPATPPDEQKVPSTSLSGWQTTPTGDGQSQEPIPDDVMTLIVRNIPARCSQSRLVKLWDPVGSYNLLYLPYNHRLRRTVGYAFINFVSHAALLTFLDRWQGNVLIPQANAKRLNIAVAEVQGLEANLLSFVHNRSICQHKSSEHLPLLIHSDGTFADFRAQVKAIKGGEGMPNLSLQENSHPESYRPPPESYGLGIYEYEEDVLTA